MQGFAVGLLHPLDEDEKRATLAA